jgi:FkbM family methyltransferase
MLGARSLWTTSGKLGLGLVDRVKYALSWYLSRHALLTMIAPAHFVMQLPGKVQAPIRPNGVDCRTLTDIFGNHVYHLQADRVKRILDLGANIGATTLFLASRFPEAKFACVEPFPGNQAMLRETIKLNNIPATVFEGAIGADAGEADLYVGCAADMYSLTPTDLSAQTIRVRKFTVPEILSSLGWDEIDLLKIDIEGYEKTLLHENNVWLNKTRMIIGEAHGHVGYRIAEVRADLAPFGFTVTQNSFDSESGLTIFEARKG